MIMFDLKGLDYHEVKQWSEDNLNDKYILTYSNIIIMDHNTDAMYFRMMFSDQPKIAFDLEENK